MEKIKSFLFSTLINMLLRYEWIPIIVITVFVCIFVPFVPWWVALIPTIGWFLHGLIATGIISLFFAFVEWINHIIDRNKKK